MRKQGEPCAGGYTAHETWPFAFTAWPDFFVLKSERVSIVQPEGPAWYTTKGERVSEPKAVSGQHTNAFQSLQGGSRPDKVHHEVWRNRMLVAWVPDGEGDRSWIKAGSVDVIEVGADDVLEFCRVR